MTEVPPAEGPTSYRGVPVPDSLRPNWDQPEAAWWRRGVQNTQDESGSVFRYREGHQFVDDVVSAYAAIERTGYELDRIDGTGGSFNEYKADKVHEERLAAEDAGRLSWMLAVEDLWHQTKAQAELRYLYQDLTMLSAWILHWAVQVHTRRLREQHQIKTRSKK